VSEIRKKSKKESAGYRRFSAPGDWLEQRPLHLALVAFAIIIALLVAAHTRTPK